VNIKIGLEVSSLGERTTTRNGATVYTIGTRNASTLLRLKDGETQVLAGLILDDERKNASKLPGMGDIPIIGRLFANQEDRKSKTEIVLAITPRIVGNISRPSAEIAEYWSGTESGISDKPQINVPVGGASRSSPSIIREQATPADDIPAPPVGAGSEPQEASPGTINNAPATTAPDTTTPSTVQPSTDGTSTPQPGTQPASPSSGRTVPENVPFSSLSP